MNKKFFVLISITLGSVLLATIAVHQYISSQNQPVDIKSVLSHDNVDNIVKTNTITYQNGVFSPSTLSTSINTTITWVNNDSVPQTLVFIDNVTSKEIAPHQTYTRTFTSTGSFLYYLKSHNDIHGVVDITSPTPTAARGG